MGCCANSGAGADKGVELAKGNQKKLVSTTQSTKITDTEAWAHVDSLWKQHKLKNNESMSHEAARPFITSYIKSVKKVDRIDDGLVMQIFNEIDDDGNQSLDRKELFDFIKKQDFKEPNQPAPMQKTKTMTQKGIDAKKSADHKDQPLSARNAAKPSVFDAAMGRVAEAEKQTGLKPLKMSVPKKETLKAVDDKDGATYEGKKNAKGLKDGFGVKQWADGAMYVGMWKNDQANGKGWLFHADGDIYGGDWVNDKASGQGTYLHVDGAKYVGAWLNDQQTGQGKETWADGSQYDGGYKNGKKSGKGHYQWNDGSSYNGEWDNNSINGQGTYKWDDGRVFVGDWVDNCMDG